MKHNTYYIRWGSSLTFLLFLLLIASNSILAAEGSRFFPETKHTVSGKFLDYWNSNGGLPTYGYPITDAQMETDPETGKTFLTQWFERHRLELHPENAGTKFEVLTGLLGKEINRTKLTTEPDFQKATQLYDPTFSKDQQWYFTETGHNLRFGFLKYWQDNGGLERFGYPISEERKELDPESGKTFMMQWFERARFEYHPENQKPFDILLGLLGKQIKGSKSSSAVETPIPPTPTAIPPSTVPRSWIDTTLLPSQNPRTTRLEVQTCIDKVDNYINGTRKGFLKGNTIPANVLVLTSFDGNGTTGRHWNQYPVKPVCYMQDWGVFESLAEYQAPYEGSYRGPIS
ncbi:hypothetical protein OZ401_004616 (plasmid) [Candidatus Chlorohelix allophototropha]|uniref:Uncharacterized protein n=2 Tax=Candidatus Chlorohelix allophototropha TaxID=3003348 RepID=A0ABY9BA98_9CHLR|nr:hypothetical protein OZ401_004616 [Chloroflexota bacterium L227-S17]